MKIEDTKIQERIKEYVRSMGIKHHQLGNLVDGEILTDLPVIIDYNAINNDWLNTGDGEMLSPQEISCLVNDGDYEGVEITIGNKESLLFNLEYIKLTKEKNRLLNKIEEKNKIIEQLDRLINELE